jgi:hypothetical protein
MIETPKETFMPTHIKGPSRIEAAGKPPKVIEEFIGRVNTGSPELSIARMRSPAGWSEPGQRPEFDEYAIVLNGIMHVEHENGALEVREGQAFVTRAGEWVRYSTPEGAEYLAVCLPAFTRNNVHRNSDKPGS